MMFKSIVRVNTEVVTRHWSGFEGEKSGTKSKVMVFMGQNAEPVSVLKDSCDHLVLFLPLRENHNARLLLFLLECNVEQLLHKFLWSDVSKPPPPPFLFFVDNEIPWGRLCVP